MAKESYAESIKIVVKENNITICDLDMLKRLVFHHRKVNNLLKDDDFENLETFFLVIKLKSAWQVFHTSGIERDEIYPSHGMREFMSVFLQNIAPKEKIKKMPWCNKDGNPYQKYEVIFGIIGPDPYFDENSNQNLSIVKLAEKYRDLYRDLNPKAHYREEKTEDDLKIFIKNCFKSVEKYTEEILNLRKLHYPKN